MFKRINYWILNLILLSWFCGATTWVFSENNTIAVYFNKEIRKVNNKVLGNNFIAYDPTTYEDCAKEYYGYSDYGAGIWDPKWNESVKEVIDLAKEAGITIVRFPGGCGTHHYNWKDAVGKKREYFLYGIDEFLKTCEAIEAEPVITVSYFTGDEKDAADLVEYFNSLNDGSNPNDGVDWAKERAKNGHLLPYSVKYFEIGNEVWHGDHRNIKKVLPDEYARRYLKYFGAMKAVDPQIKIGIPLHAQDWNKRVLEIVRDRLDFGIIHTYPAPAWGKMLEKMESKNIFEISLAIPLFRDEANFQNTLELMREKSGRDIPLAITEYNGGFVQDKPVPYRHCLGTALLNAELLRIFMKPEYNILMANYWQFCNSYWGMIKSQQDFMKHDYRYPINYIKRPNYYVFELYHKHFGDILLKANVQCDAYDISEYRSFVKNLITRIKKGVVIRKNLLGKNWQINKFPGASAETEDGILRIDFINPKAFNYYHSFKKAKVQLNTYYKLSGYIKTDNLIDDKGVCLEVQDARGWAKTHSAASTDKINETTDWQYVDVVYETLADAKAINVIARRIGEKGPLKGKVFFKDVRLEKFIPSVDTRIPYLSVNASKNKDGNKVYLMVINKNMDESITTTIDLKDFTPTSEGDAWVLNGPSIDATNEKNPDNVKIVHKKFEIKSTPFQFTFEPHSLTAIEIEKRNR